MKIVGSGTKVLDQELLSKLALSQQSGKSVTKTETQAAITSAVAGLKDAFENRSSASGLTAAQNAVANTLQLAVDSGWVKAGGARDLIAAFIGGSTAGTLKDTVEHLKLDIKNNRGGTGGSTSVRYSGRRSRTTTTPAPAPAPTPRRRRVGT